MGMGKEEGFCFSLLVFVFVFVFSFLEGSCWLAENRMHVHFNFTRLAWTVFGGRRANEKNSAPSDSSFQKFARKKSKKVGFLSAFFSHALWWKTFQQVRWRALARWKELLDFSGCETESGRTGVCDIIETRGVFGFRVLQKSFVIKVEHS